MEYISPILASLVPQTPSLIIYAVGLWLAVSRRQQYPRIYMVAGGYFALSILLRLASQVYVILPIYMSNQGISTLNIGSTFTVLNLVCVPIHIIMDIALLYAIFTPRTQSDDPNKPIFVGDQHA